MKANVVSAKRHVDDPRIPDEREERSPGVIGSCSFWLLHVRLLKCEHNKYIAPGTIGDMHVQETGWDGRVKHANFYPEGSLGFGHLFNPEWEYLPQPYPLPGDSTSTDVGLDAVCREWLTIQGWDVNDLTASARSLAAFVSTRIVRARRGAR